MSYWLKTKIYSFNDTLSNDLLLFIIDFTNDLNMCKMNKFGYNLIKLLAILFQYSFLWNKWHNSSLIIGNTNSDFYTWYFNSQNFLWRYCLSAILKNVTFFMAVYTNIYHKRFLLRVHVFLHINSGALELSTYIQYHYILKFNTSCFIVYYIHSLIFNLMKIFWPIATFIIMINLMTEFIWPKLISSI